MKKSKKRVFIILGLLLLNIICVIICYFLFYREPNSDLDLDDNATVGIMPGIDIDERRKELQDIVDRSMIAFSINTSPIFLNGTSEGNLLIENPENNAKLLKVSIVITETDDEIYASKYLKPGSYIESAKLDKVLEKGIYDAIAYISAYDEETAEYIGRTGAQITLTVKN